MVTRKNEKKATTQQTGVIDYTGAFESYDITPEEQELKKWAPAHVVNRSVYLPHKYVYVQQATASSPADTLQKICVYPI
jgi:hypothetical protein